MRFQIKDLYDITNPQEGIFKYLKDEFDWIKDEDVETLNIEYYMNHGERTISSLYDKLIKQHDINPNFNALESISKIVIFKYKDKWNRLYQAFIDVTYNPIENYSMIEDENVGSKIETDISAKNDIYGFNSTDAVPNNESDSKSVSSGSFDDNHRKLKRSGNIGVTTSQQMINSEIELRRYNFIEGIMSDINRILTLLIYC